MQLSTFTINGESFAIPALVVEEFFRRMPVTQVYGADRRIAGMVNIRGRTAAVVNMRACFSVPPVENQETEEMILLETSAGLVAEAKELGLYAFEEPLVLMVDTITQIHYSDNDEIHPAPAHIKQCFVDGVIESKEGYFTLISIEKLVTELLQAKKVG